MNIRASNKSTKHKTLPVNHVAITILITAVLTKLITGDVIEPYCSSMCGNINIPYPFGIEKGCYYTDRYETEKVRSMRVKCDRTANPPKLIFGTNLLIESIHLTEGEIRVKVQMAYNCYSQGKATANYFTWTNLVTFTISSTKNKFVATGCDTIARFTGFRHGKQYDTGCMTICNDPTSVTDNQCNGIGCCAASIPDGISNLTTRVGSFNNHINVPFNPCSVAFPVATDAFTFLSKNLSQGLGFYLNQTLSPVVFNWGIGRQNCSEAKEQGTYLCKNNTNCIDLQPDQVGYRCNCTDGFAGNPYLPQGCRNINECEEPNECEKTEYCVDTDGSYYCKCPKGYHGNGTRTDRCISSSKTWLIPVIITAGIGGSIIILLVVGFLLHWRNGERRIKQLQDRFFLQNGGEILRQKISMMHAPPKIFTAQELEDATNKYNDMNIIGKGGFGIVYRGIIENNQQVAIKRSLKVDPDQVEQFTNEILIFSQINNRNVVRLLGCCLETEVPLLVYEYINNGTLYDHLHVEAKIPLFTWNKRLGIASQVAEVLAYLHSTILTPIIHRDMKSMNILLDECYTAKVADFGASRLVPVDQDQFATMVLGTLGYLDPEYMQTSELTEKSDVYSFGVVLVELLTRKKALSYQRPEIERSLAMHFLFKMKEDRLFDIIDKNISNSQENIEQIKKVATLAKWCLYVKGEDRPTMKEVAMELEGIKGMNKHPWHNVKSSLDRENDSEYLLQGFPKHDDGNSGGNSGKDSDLYKPPGFSFSLGGGR